MSNSRKRQQARARTQAPAEPTQPAALDARPIAAPFPQALYDRAIAAATRAGQMRDEGERLCYVYNGDVVALKYTEPGEDEGQPARLMIAAFKQGVVFQTEGDRLVVYRSGDWEKSLEGLEPAADDDEEAPEEGSLPDEADDEEGSERDTP